MKEGRIEQLLTSAKRVLHPSQAKHIDRLLEEAQDEFQAAEDKVDSGDSHPKVDIDLLAVQSLSTENDKSNDAERLLPLPSEIQHTHGVSVSRYADGRVHASWEPF